MSTKTIRKCDSKFVENENNYEMESPSYSFDLETESTSFIFVERNVMRCPSSIFSTAGNQFVINCLRTPDTNIEASIYL